MTTPAIVGDPSALMTIVGAVQHKRYSEVIEEVGSEINFLRPVIEMALYVDEWLNELIKLNQSTFESRPFASEYVVLEALGGWIIDQLIDMGKAGVHLHDIGNGTDMPIAMSEALDFARERITKETGFKFAGHRVAVYIEPEFGQ